jgi:hypothetical protein
VNYIPAPKSIELHLGTSPEFSRYSKKVKALGGTYSECRGYASHRFVHLPLTEDGKALANKLISEFGRPANKTTTVVRGLPADFRGKHIHAPVVVHYVNKNEADPCGAALAKYEEAFLQAFPDAVNPEPVVAKPPKPLAADLRLNSRAQFWAVLEALQQYIDNGNDAEHLIDDAQIDEFKSKLRAAEQFRDQLDAVLASLANG